MSENGFVDLGYARVDTDRARRCGFPEVIFGAGKTPADVLGIARAILSHSKVVLATRVTQAHFDILFPELPEARFHERAKCITVELDPLPKLKGTIGVVCAGTSDLPVADEAAVTLEVFGNQVERYC